MRKIVSTSFNMADTITDGTTTVAFTYDGEHGRIVQASTVGGVTTTTNYLNDPASGAMSEKAVTGLAAVWTDYLTADGQIVAQRTAGLPPSVWNSFTWGAAPWTAPAAWSYFSLDPLSSIAVIADANGNIAQRLSYDAWGKPRNSDGTDAACGTIKSPSTRGFTNQEQIAALCQVNLNARIYDPTIARFFTPDDVVADPYDPQGLNRYTYVDNRPLTLADPTGHDPDDLQAQSKSPGQGATGNFASNGDFHSAEMHDGSLTSLWGTGYSASSRDTSGLETQSPLLFDQAGPSSASHLATVEYRLRPQLKVVDGVMRGPISVGCSPSLDCAGVITDMRKFNHIYGKGRNRYGFDLDIHKFTGSGKGNDVADINVGDTGFNTSANGEIDVYCLKGCYMDLLFGQDTDHRLSRVGTLSCRGTLKFPK